jgi:hypothetical protein
MTFMPFLALTFCCALLSNFFHKVLGLIASQGMPLSEDVNR